MSDYEEILPGVFLENVYVTMTRDRLNRSIINTHSKIINLTNSQVK